MLVYRMEHKTLGIGPFRAMEHSSKLSDDERIAFVKFDTEWGCTSDSPNHPVPMTDGIQYFRWTQVGGCYSFDGIFHWFDIGECFTYLKRANCIIRVYEVPDDDCEIGKTQVAFEKYNAAIVDEIEL